MPTTTIEKKELYKMIDELPDNRTAILFDFVKLLQDEDDEPLSEYELEQLKIAEREISEGNFVSWEEAKKELAKLP